MLAAMPTFGEVMTKDVLTVEPSDTIGEAAEKMTSLGVGAVVVSDFGRMIGIFTERDLMRAVAGRVHSSEARVREWMTPDPVTMTEDASVEEAGFASLRLRLFPFGGRSLGRFWNALTGDV